MCAGRCMHVCVCSHWDTSNTQRNTLKWIKKMQMWKILTHMCTCMLKGLFLHMQQIQFNDVKSWNRRKRIPDNWPNQSKKTIKTHAKRPSIKTGPLLQFGFKHTLTHPSPSAALGLHFITDLNKRIFFFLFLSDRRSSFILVQPQKAANPCFIVNQECVHRTP